MLALRLRGKAKVTGTGVLLLTELSGTHLERRKGVEGLVAECRAATCQASIMDLLPTEPKERDGRLQNKVAGVCTEAA